MLNSFSGVGKVELDPKLLKTPNGKDYAKMIVSIPRTRSQDGKTAKDRINVDVWGKLYDTAKWCKAGDVIAFEGSLQVNNFKNQAGEWVSSWAVNAHSIDIIQRMIETQAPQTGPAQYGPIPQQPAQTVAHCPAPPAPPPVVADIPGPTDPPPENMTPFYLPDW